MKFFKSLVLYAIKYLSQRTSTNGRKPVVVIDAGIATDDNLKNLKAKQYPYVCVSRSKLKDYLSEGGKIIKLHDKRDQPIEPMGGKTRQ